MHEREETGLEIAVIGMSGRFPGANTVEMYWENLIAGKDCVSRFSDTELLNSGLSKELIGRSDYVKSKGIVEGIEEFDARFFDYSPREAKNLDPQTRLIHECVWEALENAGYCSQPHAGSVGLYVGGSTDQAWLELLLNRGERSAAERMETGLLGFKDSISTLTSYKLGLNGPSFTIYTACSTSALSVHLACRALLTGDCDIAAAGGASVYLPVKKGYLYQAGLTSSPDGTIRPFDEKASGALFSDGAGIVVLKRYEDALKDGDNIHAVILGTASNNDGGRSVGYTAPSIEGQADVISEALEFAEVDPASISYIETHGTATQVGDTIEIEALKRAFPNELRGSCALGSVKSNIGHLDTASGVAGLIKVILALKHRKIPPTINFERPNSRIDLIESPFYIAGELEEWEQSSPRAGVSSFGFGGTNVHMILEAPPVRTPKSASPTPQIIPVSARSEAALREAVERVADYFKSTSSQTFDDACYTLQVGRKSFEHRVAVVASDSAMAFDRLGTKGSSPFFAGHVTEQNRDLNVVLDIGDMSRVVPGIFTDEKLEGQIYSAVKALLNEEESAASSIGFTNADLLQYDPDNETKSSVQEVIVAASIGRILRDIGSQPASIHATGNGLITAGLISGRLTLQEAITLVAGGALTGARERTSATSIFERRHKQHDKIKGLSDGRAIEDPLLSKPQSVLRIAIGQSAATESDDPSERQQYFNSPICSPPDEELLRLVGFCWISGIDVNWDALHCRASRQRVALPTYPFQKKRLWLPDVNKPGVEQQTHKLDEMSDWFTVPVWQAASDVVAGPIAAADVAWLVLHDGQEGLKNVEAAIRHSDATLCVASWPAFIECPAEQITESERKRELGQLLDKVLQANNVKTLRIVHALTLTQSTPDEDFEEYLGGVVDLVKVIATKDPSIQFKLAVLTCGAAKVFADDQISAEKWMMRAPITVAPQEHPNIHGRLIDIDQETLDSKTAATKLVSDLASVSSASMVAYRNGQRFENTYKPIEEAHELVAEIQTDPQPPIGKLKQGGVYLITGGLGVVGLTMARYLARRYSARLALLSRTGLPDRREWSSLLETHSASDRIGFRIRQVQELENCGASVKVFAADVCDEVALANVVKSVEKEWGAINGVIHAAGVLRVESAETPIVRVQAHHFHEQLRPKLIGLRALMRVFEAKTPDFRIAVSSLSPILGGLGHVAYAAANLALDGEIAQQTGDVDQTWLGVAWNDWQYVGPDFDKAMPKSSMLDLSMTETEAEQTLECVTMLGTFREVVISTGNINDRITQWVNPDRATKSHQAVREAPTDNREAKFKSIRSSAEIRRFLVQLCQEFFDVTSIDTGTNLFELGATSLHVVQLHSKVIDAIGQHVPIAIFFEHPTLASLADALAGECDPTDSEATHNPDPSATKSPDVAIIGMAGRFPNAENIEEFWRNIDAALPSIRFFDRQELLDAGISQAELDRPDYVPAKGYLSGSDEFDAEFFEYTPHDVRIMDPQLRVFHECAWTAFEHAGYAIRSYPGRVGVFAGASPNLYWQAQSMLGQLSEQASSFEAAILNDKDSLSTQISYKFNLSGPSVTVFTGCSTSLVAIEAAYRAIINGECDMCLAGGVTVSEPSIKGYIYEPGMAYSSDGHCRAFDEAASGMVFGDGVGAVVLKSLDQALLDGDTIHAVIKGSAVNNDGYRKVGYTAPSVDGQAEVIRMAHQRGGIDPDTIDYVETHGTGTKLGDVVEVAAMKKAFGDRSPLPIGSVKSQVGHLNAAAGVTGVIKAVEMLKHRVIPENLNFDTPNSQCEFESGPLFVNRARSEWRDVDRPIRIGVNSFGIGGTNAHAVLEEAPPSERIDAHDEGLQTVILSAVNEAALERSVNKLKAHVEAHPDTNFADLAYTLQLGREAFSHRLAFTAKSLEDARLKLEDRRGVVVKKCEEHAPQIVFMFPGNGAEYVDMAMDFYRHEVVFSEALNLCLRLAENETGETLRSILYPRTEDERRLAEIKLKDMRFNQPLVFSVEYATAMLLNSWGIIPSVLIGYSLGDYVAATLAGVFQLEDALRIVCARGRLLSGLTPGAMLSLPLPVTKASIFIEESGMAEDLSIAIDNGKTCIVSGVATKVEAFEKYLKSQSVMCMRIKTTIAAHSHLTRTIEQEFRELIESVELCSPNVCVISGVTGKQLSDEEAQDANHWVEHLYTTIRFATGIQCQAKLANSIFVEVGPGRDLSVLVKRSFEGTENTAVWIMPPEKLASTVEQSRAGILAKLWANGVAIDWQRALHQGKKRYRIPLPTYPFEKNRFESSTKPLTLATSSVANFSAEVEKTANVTDWFYTREWESLLNLSEAERISGQNILIVCGSNHSFVDLLVKKFAEAAAASVAVVQSGEPVSFDGQEPAVFDLELETSNDNLMGALEAAHQFPDLVVDCRSVVIGEGFIRDATDRTPFYDTLRLVKAIAAAAGERIVTHKIVTNRSQNVLGIEQIEPINASLMGLSLVARQEIPSLSCATIDLEDLIENDKDTLRAAEQIFEVCQLRSPPALIACRGSRFWRQAFHAAPIKAPEQKAMLPKKKGTYLITGGFGGIGRILAEYLASSYQANLVLITRPLPKKTSQDWSTQTPKKRKQHKSFAAKLEDAGARVRIEYANVADEAAMKSVMLRTEKHFDDINGVIHAAGLPSGDTFKLLREIREQDCDQQFEAKQSGTIVLDRLLASRDVDFALAMSSISTILGGLGFAGYAPANMFMRAYLAKQSKTSQVPWISVDWSDWKYWSDDDSEQTLVGESIRALSIEAAEGIDCFERCLGSGRRDIIHSPGDINKRTARWVDREESDEEHIDISMFDERPKLTEPYLAPENEVEVELADILCRVFRISSVGINDDFFDLGGDSLKGVTAVTRIHKKLGVEVPLTQLFETPTISGLARYIDNMKRDDFVSIPVALEQEHYCLSAAQRRIYILNQLYPDTTAYNDPMVFQVDGALDYAHAEAVFQRVVERHEGLRTVFEMVGDQPQQRILEDLHFSIERFEVAESDLDNAIASFIKPFDLSQAPLFRVAVFKYATNRHILAIDLHHIITDGGSSDRLIRDFVALYEGVPLPPLKLQYKDYSEWQQSQVAKEIASTHESYWLETLADFPPPASFPASHSLPNIPEFAGRSVAISLSRLDYENLKALTQREGVTVFAGIMAVFKALLWRYSGQSDLVVGTPVAGRPHPDLEEIVGIFVNTLPIRTQISDFATFRSLLATVADGLSGAIDHQRYQYEELLRVLNLHGTLQKSPLFKVLIVQQRMDSEEISVRDLKIRPFRTDLQRALFDQVLNVYETPDSVSITLDYAASLYSKEAMERLGGQFSTLLSELVARPDDPIEQIALGAKLEEVPVHEDFFEATAFTFESD